MAKITRYGGDLKAFASEAVGQERTVFGTSEFDDDLSAQINALFRRGWGIVAPDEEPKIQDFNALGYTTTQLLAYLHQMGIAEWHADQTYYTDSVVVHDGRLWMSQVDEPTDVPGTSAQWGDVSPAVSGDTEATPDSLAKRNAQGTFKVSAPTDAAHPARKTELDSHVSSASAHAAASLTYDPSGSSFTATKVQGALDEAAVRLDTVEGTAAESPATVSFQSGPNTWTGNPKATVVHTSLRRCIVDNTGAVQYYLDRADSRLKEDGTPSELDGSAGQVMVEMLPFYAKTVFAGQTTHWSVSPIPRPGYVLHPAFEGGVQRIYIGAFEGLVLQASTGFYLSGLNLNDNRGRVDLVQDSLASVVPDVSDKTPMVGLTRGEFRTLAQNGGFQLMDFWMYQALCLLYITEYGNWSSKTAIAWGNSRNAAYLPSSSNQSDSRNSFPGLSLDAGDHSGGTNETSNNSAWNSYRGVEALWGSGQDIVDGWNVNALQSFVSNDEAVYADDTTAGYVSIGSPTPSSPTDTRRYATAWQNVHNAFLVGGITTSNAESLSADTFWTNSGWRIASVGGAANDQDGIFSHRLEFSSSDRGYGRTARIALKVRA